MKFKKTLLSALFVSTFIGVFSIGSNMVAQAEDGGETIQSGVFIGDVDVSGKTQSEASQILEDYIAREDDTKIKVVIGNHEKEIKVGEFGINWDDTSVVEEALQVGKKGNLIQRYKIQKDLEIEPHVISIPYTVDREQVKKIVEEKCKEFDVEPVNATLSRKNNNFSVIEGTNGLKLDEEGAVDTITSYLTDDWDLAQGEVSLPVKEEKPAHDSEKLSMVKDVLGTFTTDFSSSPASRAKNLDTGAAKINGSVVYPGETFSAYEATHPYTEENGYGYGSAFENGKVVPSLGGGICQVSTTLYNTVLNAELEVTQRSNHTMLVSYVKPSMDAAIAGTTMDLKFKNNTDTPIYIEGYTQNRKITFTIYGHETRSANREVRYESEVTGNTPAGIKLEASNSPIGTISQTQTPHDGSTAELWKVVTENGKETRTKINSSTYVASPTVYSVGVSSSDPTKTAAMKAAIATGSIDQVKSVANSLLSESSNASNDGQGANEESVQEEGQDPNSQLDPESGE